MGYHFDSHHSAKWGAVPNNNLIIFMSRKQHKSSTLSVSLSTFSSATRDSDRTDNGVKKSVENDSDICQNNVQL